MSSVRGERGQVAGIEALPFGLLVFISGALLLVNLWGVVDTKFAADAAAREATRYVVEAAESTRRPEEVRATAELIARQTFADHGKTQPIDVELVADRPGLERCTRVRVRVSSSVPAIRLPFVGGFGDGFRVVATHSQLIDPTRSGVAGRADCLA